MFSIYLMIEQNIVVSRFKRKKIFWAGVTREQFLHKDKVRRFAGKCSFIHKKAILRLISSTLDATDVLHETHNHCAISCMSAKFILAIVVLKPNTFPQTN